MTIELPVDAHIPVAYIEHERLRLEAYRKIADADTPEQLDSIAEELDDRYGAPPEPVANLLEVARLRLEVRACGISDVVSQGKYVRLSPVELAESAALRIRRLYPGTVFKPAVRQVLVPAALTQSVGGKPIEGLPVLDWVRGVLDATALRPAQTPPAAG